MSENSQTFLGIDGGATHSFAVAVDGTGRMLASARAGSMNFFGAGLAEARRNLKQLLAGLTVVGERLEFERAIIGCAALFGESTVAEKESLCHGLIAGERIRVVSDAMTAFMGASLGEPGVLVIAGTGSMILVRSEDGRFSHVGGWGHLVGDDGSAYWIAREAIRAAIDALEARGPATALVDLVCRWLQVKSLPDIVPILHGPGFGKDRLAALVKFLSEHNAAQDDVFSLICKRAGRLLAEQALVAIRLSGLKAHPPSVYFVGGLIENESTVRESLVAHLQATAPVRVTPAQLPPVVGAAFMALNDAGIAVTPEVLARLREANIAAA